MLPLCEFEESEEVPRLDCSTALGVRSTALGARLTALGVRLTALGAESTALRDESTAPLSRAASVPLRPGMLCASAVPDSVRTSAAVVVIILTEFIGLDLWLPLFTDNPAGPTAFRWRSIVAGKLIRGLKLGREIGAIAFAREGP